ncbi:MAG: hypothetical protein ABEI86_05295, partial [Halobacteriaceae archaeon]
KSLFRKPVVATGILRPLGNSYSDTLRMFCMVRQQDINRLYSLLGELETSVGKNDDYRIVMGG